MVRSEAEVSTQICLILKTVNYSVDIHTHFWKEENEAKFPGQVGGFIKQKEHSVGMERPGLYIGYATKYLAEWLLLWSLLSSYINQEDWNKWAHSLLSCKCLWVLTDSRPQSKTLGSPCVLTISVFFLLVPLMTQVTQAIAGSRARHVPSYKGGEAGLWLILRCRLFRCLSTAYGFQTVHSISSSLILPGGCWETLRRTPQAENNPWALLDSYTLKKKQVTQFCR